MIYLPTFIIATKSTIHVGKYTVRHMDPMEYIHIYICTYLFGFKLPIHTLTYIMAGQPTPM